jgi:hypothetical protein
VELRGPVQPEGRNEIFEVVIQPADSGFRIALTLRSEVLSVASSP